ncbi:MAG TPA: sialate O-acetylesterase [Opitutaceae bacterium]|nr:sialate O-acetylesterase [Opitutaceae bacterium]
MNRARLMPVGGRLFLPLLLPVLVRALGAAEAPADGRSPVDATPAVVRLESPRDYQVFQRTDARNGAITVEGTWSVPRHTSAPPDALQFRVVGSPAGGDAAAWQPLPFNPGARGFRARIPLAPGGWYRVDVRLLRHESPLATTAVAHVGVGEVFLIAGQSNSANYDEERQRPTTGRVAAFDGTDWRIAADPEPGATGKKGSFIPSFGDALVRRFHVPVGVVCIGVGGTSIREWMPAGHPMALPPTTGAHCLVLADGSLVSTGELFDLLVGRLRGFPPHGLRAVLWHQGESDWHQPPGHGIALAAYRADLGELIADSRRAAGWNVPWFVAQVSYGNPSVPGSDAMRAQQRAVVDDRLTFGGPNTDTLTGLLREKHGQGVHFSAEGQRRHGALWAEIVGDWIARRDDDVATSPAAASPRP